MGTGLCISSEPMAAEGDAQFVRDGLSLYNVARTGYDHWRPLKLFVRDDAGMIRGGLLGPHLGRMASRHGPLVG